MLIASVASQMIQPRVRAEAEAVEHVMRMVREGQATWVSSTVLSIEVSRNPDPDRRRDAEALLLFANEIVVPKSGEADRADKSRNGASARSMRCTWPAPKKVARMYSSLRTTVYCVAPDEVLGSFTSGLRTLYRGMRKCNHDLHRQND
jgi:hypothetical protein